MSLSINRLFFTTTTTTPITTLKMFTVLLFLLSTPETAATVFPHANLFCSSRSVLALNVLDEGCPEHRVSLARWCNKRASGYLSGRGALEERGRLNSLCLEPTLRIWEQRLKQRRRENLIKKWNNFVIQGA